MRNVKHQLGRVFFFSHRQIKSAIKKQESISDCVMLEVRWCDISFVKVHAPSEDMEVILKIGFMKK